MKRNLYILALVLVLVLSLALTGCQKACEHEWEDANCSDPKTCELCGETEGAPLGHVWKAAACDTPKTCEECGKTDGEALGHSWQHATCEAAKICTACKLTEGEALGHTWVDATTEAPKTCTTCAATEGEAIDTDDRFVTADCQALFGTWTGLYTQTAEDMELTDVDAELVTNVDFVFNNDGTLLIVDYIEDLEAYKADYVTIYTATLYMTFESLYGWDQDAADAAMIQDSGMTVPEFAQSYADGLTADDFYTETECVYYVDSDALYIGLDWSEDLGDCDFTLEGDVLTIDYFGDELVLTKTTD